MRRSLHPLRGLWTHGLLRHHALMSPHGRWLGHSLYRYLSYVKLNPLKSPESHANVSLFELNSKKLPSLKTSGRYRMPKLSKKN